MDYITIEGIADQQSIQKKCSRLILGTGDFFQIGLDNSYDILDAFIEHGGNTLDMAHQYIQAEEIIGNWMKKRNNRDRLILLTKAAHPDDGEAGNRLKPDLITQDLLESLGRLKTDYIDLYALHRDDETVAVNLIIDRLNEHIKAGQIHAIGASNWRIERVEDANHYAKENGLIGFSFSSTNLSLAKAKEAMWAGCVSADQATVAWHEEQNLPLLSWSSQAGGFFSGAFTKENTENEDMVRVYYNDENWERSKRAKELASKKGVTAIQIALAYVLSQSFPTSAIIGPRLVSELLSSIKGSAIKLSQAEVDWLDLK